MVKTPAYLALLSLVLCGMTADARNGPPLVGGSIFDKDFCTTDVECGLSRYCAEQGPTGGICRPRLSDGSDCTFSNQCTGNSLCTFSPTRYGTNICERRRKLGEKCSSDRLTCLDGLSCEDGTCVTKPAGRAGAECRTPFECDQAGGFFCKFGPSSLPPGTCTPKFKDGAACGRNNDSGECLGYCELDAFTSFGTCRPLRPLGARCTEDIQCAAVSKPADPRDYITCNKLPGQGVAGTCAAVSQLKRRLGAPCTRSSDKCDASRGLVCRWAASRRRTVCQQIDAPDGTLCKRGSALSKCKKGLECRLRRKVPAQPSTRDSSKVQTTECLPVRRVVAPGTTCDLERNVCGGISSCREIPGVKLVFASRRGPVGAVYCVRTLKRGSRCSPQEKFVALCEDGYQCLRGRCRKQNSAPIVEKHANENVSCRDLPCVPGLKCTSFKFCVRA